MILQLPPEILGLICKLCTVGSRWDDCDDCTDNGDFPGNCEKKTVMALRLVNKKFEEASTPFVFCNIRLRLFPGSLARLDKLSHSNLAKHVRSVDFHADLLPVWDEQQWLSAVDDRPRIHDFRESQPNYRTADEFSTDIDDEVRTAYEKLPRHSLSAIEIEAGWSAYETHLREQQPWRENPGEFAMILKSLLIKLPNLRRTRIGSSQFEGQPCQEKFWESFYRATRVRRDVWLYNRNKAEDFLKLAYVEAIGLRNAHLGVKSVQKLDLDVASREGFRILEDGSNTRSVTTAYIPRLENMIKAFEPLTELNLCLPGADPYTTVGDSGQVQQMLRAARKIRTLVLTYGISAYDMYDESGAPLAHFALMPFLSNPQVTYPYLEELSIEGAVPAEVFSNFLKLHASTLRRLSIFDSYSDDWKIVLLSIARHLMLDRRHLHRLSDGCHKLIGANTWTIDDEDFRHQYHFGFNTDEPEDPYGIYRPYPYQRRLFTAMEKFFEANGEGGLPQEYHDEEHDSAAAERALPSRYARNE